MGCAFQKAKRGAGEAVGGLCGQYAPMTFCFLACTLTVNLSQLYTYHMMVWNPIA
jgi:hypothetical protein